MGGGPPRSSSFFPTVYSAFAQLDLFDLPTGPRGRKAGIFTCIILKIRLWELKEAGICPESTKALGWGENLVLQILHSAFPGLSFTTSTDGQRESGLYLFHLHVGESTVAQIK